MEELSQIKGMIAYIIVNERNQSIQTYGDHFKIEEFLKKWFPDVEAHSDSINQWFLVHFNSKLSVSALNMMNYLLLKYYKVKLITI